MPSKPHPLRRISTNSLTSLARSQSLGESPSNPHTSPSHLDFLAPALQDLVDESASLAHNIKNLSQLHDALGMFNDSFAAYLYALKMNAFCVDWKEGPDDRSFKRMDLMGPAPQQVPEQYNINQQPTLEQSNNDVEQSYLQPQDMTYCTAPDVTTEADTTIQAGPTSSRGRGIPRGRVVPGSNRGRGGAVSGRSVAVEGQAGRKKIALTPIEKRKREAAVNAIVDTLPIEYRGNDPVRIALSATTLGSSGISSRLYTLALATARKEFDGTVAEIIKPPELPQAKVNKCLIALVGKKAVSKTAVGAVDRMTNLVNKASIVRERLLNEQIATANYAFKNGIDVPDLRDFKWAYGSLDGKADSNIKETVSNKIGKKAPTAPAAAAVGASD
ncbi:hypothetical protein QFC21_005691 [Naganishia friedmannii]|uniref:Uncharacterized protein n=1 Tax=Naganishia friedmannii TaxID=89922 RepID=A0ACC2V8U4_9TREE|nr:hypothetical protein QFC21_005691 [Naganishia friedmannii]